MDSIAKEAYDFTLGEEFMLFKLKKYLEGAVDNIQIAVRVQNFILKEEENARKNRNYNPTETVREHQDNLRV